jgi:hypothetical protein
VVAVRAPRPTLLIDNAECSGNPVKLYVYGEIGDSLNHSMKNPRSVAHENRDPGTLFRTAHDSYCFDLHKYFDVDSLAAMVAQTKIVRRTAGAQPG